MRHLTIPVRTKELHIYPICDVQMGGKGVDLRGFQEHIDDAMADPLARFIGVGDYTDGVSPSNRKLLKAAFDKGELYDTPNEMLTDSAKRQVHDFLDIVAPTRGKWDFLVSGHHYWEYVVNKTIRTTDDDIAEFLGCPSLGDESVVANYVWKGKPRPFRLWARHGEGSGVSFAAPLNQLERQMRGFTADAYVIGHHHKLVAAGAVKLDEAPEAETQLAATDSRLVAAGSWMHGFLPNESTYAEKGMMVPLATGAPIIFVTKRDDGTFKVRTLI
ncbi:MAG: hypothetical protein E6Q97_29890 [Desulfurellales bacterium]|nr:MAG: hypothetical protein E6Q97_29890 [Desulfurellales bacterium]